MNARWVLMSLVLCGAEAARGAPIVFDMPSDDRWQYPFNFAPGTKPTCSTFGSTADPNFDSFNDRDGIMLVAWETDSQLETGLDPQVYDVRAVRITLTAAAGNGAIGQYPVADWKIDLTPDEWSWMRYPINDRDPGQPIEMFGVGFDKFFTALTWSENSFYVGGDDFGYSTRDPFPFVFDDTTGELIHVEDSVKDQFTPTPWAIGVPVGYTPGSQTTPFPVIFDVDLELSGGLVREHFQDALSQGKVFAAFTSLFVTFEQASSGFPSFFTKEAAAFIPNAAPARLEICLTPTGDADGDEWVSLDDVDQLDACADGPGASGSFNCRCDFDFDNDADVDLADLAKFINLFDGV